MLVVGFCGQQCLEVKPEFLPGRICHKCGKVRRQTAQTTKISTKNTTHTSSAKRFFNCQPTVTNMKC